MALESDLGLDRALAIGHDEVITSIKEVMS